MTRCHLLLLIVALVPILDRAQAQDTLFNNKRVYLISDQPLPEDARRSERARRMAEAFFNVTSTLADPSTLSFFPLDYTYSPDRNVQKKMFVLNADVKAPIALGGKRWNTAGKAYHAIQIIPRFRVRQFQDDESQGDQSLPIRTPSYMPGIKYFLTFKSMWEAEKSKRQYLSFYAYHHSNGQDGFEYNDDGSVNFYNGNFSEDVVFEIGYNAVSHIPFRGVIEEKAQTQVKRKSMRFWSANYEFHPRPLSSPAFRWRKIYARRRLNLQYGHIFTPMVRDMVYSAKTDSYYTDNFRPVERRRFLLNVSYAVDAELNRIQGNKIHPVRFFDTRRLNAELSFYEKLMRTPYASVFAQAGYYGSDPYNIYFPQDLFFFRVGLAFGFFANDFF